MRGVELQGDRGVRGPAPMAFALSLAIFIVLIGLTWPQHRDVGDAQVYQVVARNIVRTGQWQHLRYLASVYPSFYEHLPFGFWPLALSIKWFGDGSLIPLCAILAVLTVSLTGWIAARLAGPWAGFAALFILATTQKFFYQISYPTLDPLLLFPATAAAAFVWLGSGRWNEWLWAGLLLCVAMAIKGPFGAVPFVSAALARALVDRKWSWLAGGIIALTAAALPIALFLAFHQDWWQQYLLRQVVDSLTGARADGSRSHWAATRSIVGRFWPWFPLILAGLCMALEWPRPWAKWLYANDEDRPRFLRALRLIGISAAIGLLCLSLPGRHIWHHTLVLFPTLSILCGIAVGPRLTRIFSSSARLRALNRGLQLALIAALIAMAFGWGRVQVDPPCVVSQEFKSPLCELRPGEDVAVISPRDEWDLISALAMEKDVTPWPGTSMLDPVAKKGHFALIRVERWESLPPWNELNRARGWVLAKREE